MMRTDSVVRMDGMRVLLESLGKVDAERFISLIIKEPFDYTAWQKNMFADVELHELSKKAMESLNS